MAIRLRQVTLVPTGADGSAVATATLSIGRPCIVRFIKVDYQNQPATVDLLIKDGTTSGATLFTNTSSNTDVAFKPVGMPGVDEGGAATAATDGLAGGWPVPSGALFFDVAQGDGQTSGNEAVVIDLLVEV